MINLKKIWWTYSSLSTSLKIATCFAAGAILSIIFYAIFLIIVTSPIDQFTISNAGVFGDSFGVLTSLFSALAFAGVAFTLAMQKDELAIQRQELIEQKKETADNRKEIKKQGFENTFFQMLKLHNQLIAGIATHQSGAQGIITKDGRAVLKDMSEALDRQISAQARNGKVSEDGIKIAFESFYGRRDAQLAHYFRFLYNIFRFISESESENKDLYARLVRAQLSNPELYLLFYNSLTERGSEFKKYIIEFQLMDNLEPQELANIEHQHLIVGAGFKNASSVDAE